jgi:predicted secreted hydrolase
MTRAPQRFILLILATYLLAGCAVADDPSATRQISESEERPASRLLEERDDPHPIDLPADAAPHDRLTEWWYYTGHLEDGEGDLYGFQFVIFQVLRGDFPPTYAAHFAVTNTSDDEFSYAEHVDSFLPAESSRPIDLKVGEWTLIGGDGEDSISASMDNYTLEIDLITEKPPVFHEGDGFFEFAPAAASYYYSRTRMTASGTLKVNGEPRTVTGTAWFDQQWGDFLVTTDVGWDWFSVQLDNGKELMAWQSHDGEGDVLDGNATIVQEDGSVIDIPESEVIIEPLDQWESPRTGGRYPMGWKIEIPSRDIRLMIEPVMEDQELNTLSSTGVIYWEGMVAASGDWNGETTEGLGYVELTGYAEVDAD